MSEHSSLTTRGAAFAAPRRFILLILLLALLVSAITPVFASNDVQIDLTSTFFATPSGTCSDHPAVFDEDEEMADFILESYSLYFIQVSCDVKQLAKTTAGSCYYDLSSSFEEWSASEHVVREDNNTIFLRSSY